MRREHVQDILIEDRVRAYKQLAGRLFDLWWDVPLLQTGLEPLRWPKNVRLSPDFYDDARAGELSEQKALAQRTNERLEQLKAFVHSNSLVLTPSVQKEFWEAYDEFMLWRIRVGTRDEREMMPHFLEIQAAFDNLRARPCEAIMKDLGTEGFGIVGAEALKDIRVKASQRVKARMNGVQGG